MPPPENNPCLIGEAGVGKTAIAEGIAQRIAEGKVPARLQDKEIYLLDLTALVAGTQFRGQFEQRVKGLLSEIKAAGNVILFIDEIHNIVGAGDSDGAMNAANIMENRPCPAGRSRLSAQRPLPSTASLLKKILHWSAASSPSRWKNPPSMTPLRLSAA